MGIATASMQLNLMLISPCCLAEVRRLSACLLLLIYFSDNSGRIIVWDLGSHKPLQTIDASFAGSATSLCWVNVLKDGTAADESRSPAFAVGFGTGIIAIYRQSLDNVRKPTCLNVVLTAFSFAASF
jgi:hypothetical protein